MTQIPGILQKSLPLKSCDLLNIPPNKLSNSLLLFTDISLIFDIFPDNLASFVIPRYFLASHIHIYKIPPKLIYPYITKSVR